MKIDKKRYLSHFAPEIIQRKELPANLVYTQLFTLDCKDGKTDENPRAFDELFLSVRIEAYQTDNFGLFHTLGKPISKMIR